MSEVTSPILTDATGQEIVSKLNTLLTKMDNLAAAFQPNASGIVYNNTTSGLTGDDVQEAIDEMAGDVSEIKSALSNIGFDYSDFRCFVKRPVNMDRFMAVIPCTTPLPTSVTVNSFQYMGNGWTSLTLDVASIIGSSIVLQFNLPSGVTISNGLDYWAKGSVTLNYT